MSSYLYHIGNETTYIGYPSDDEFRINIHPGGGGDDQGLFRYFAGGGFNFYRNHSRAPQIYNNFGSGNCRLYWQRSGTNWRWEYNTNGYYYIRYNGSEKGYFHPNHGNVYQIDFTGQHRSFISGIPQKNHSSYVGMIVCANKNKYFDISSNTVVTGNKAINVSEALPLVTLSNVAYDKTCYGVISDTEDPDKIREYQIGALVSTYEKGKGDNRAYINAVGEGAVWVVNTGGTLESGDYVTTSNVPGYGMKQDDDLLHNYTVCKVTMDVNFAPQMQRVRKPLQQLSDVNYWVKRTYNDTTENVYNKLEASIKKRTILVKKYVDETRQITLTEENYNLLDQKEKEKYVEKDCTVYQIVNEEEFKEPEEDTELEVRQEYVNVLDEDGEIVWMDTDEFEPEYNIRYLTADGEITDEANAVHIAAFVGCTYHCG